MRHFAITGIVTASWISRTLSGSAMRATPPSRRMSAGTRSSAITATAPASSATRACSASITSMITPPLSISASPVLTRIVPVSCIAVSLAREERLDGAPELVRLLQEEHVTGVVEHDQLGAGEPVGRVGEPRLGRARGLRALDLRRELVGHGGACRREHELPHPRRVRRGVRDRDDPAVGEAEQVDPLEREMLP